MWALFFLVPVGRGIEEERIKPEEYEVVFEKLYNWSKTKPYAVKTTEAPHYRRFVMQRGGNPLAGPHDPQAGAPDSSERRGHRAPLGVTDGKGIMFVSHIGEILPAGFLPIRCGGSPGQRGRSLSEAPRIPHLRGPSRFKGKCGVCEYNTICGGSRSRAFGVTGDPLESEPDCLHMPEKLRDLPQLGVR